jgi:cysteine desulfurase
LLETAPLVKTGQTPLYLDNNATTQIDPVVLEAMLPWLQDGYGNPSSVYGLGRAAHAAIETARAQVATLLGARESDVIFTSCGTESINTAILSACSLDPDKRTIITSAVEHSATLKLCDHLARRGYEIVRLPVDDQGHLSIDALREAITEETAVVSLLWANNETGVLFPVEQIAQLCRERRVLLHFDAVQVPGKLPIDFQKLEADFLSISGHKLHAPKGIGALAVHRRVKFQPLLRGSQEESRRGGTENVASIVALGAAAEQALQHLPLEETTIRSWRDRFEQTLLETVPETLVNGDRIHRLPNTSNLSFSGIEAEGALLLLDEAGLCCSAGSACTSGSVAPSHVLMAMGCSRDRARASLRFSFGRLQTEADIDAALEIIPEVIAKLRALAPVTPASSPVKFASAPAA